MTKKELICHLETMNDNDEIILTDMYCFNKGTGNLGITNISVLGIAIDPIVNKAKFIIDQTEVVILNENRIKENTDDAFNMIWMMPEN